MALFARYKPSTDLQSCCELLSRTGRQIHLTFATGSGAEYRDHLMVEAATSLQECRRSLLADGRSDEIPSLAKYLYRIGVMDDNRPYRALYAPLVKNNLLAG